MAAEFGSTAALAIFVFQRLSAGKRRKPFKLQPCPMLIPLHALGGGGGFPPPPDCAVTVTLMEPEALLPGFGFVTDTGNVPALASVPVPVSFVEETKVVVRAEPPNNICAPLTNFDPFTVRVYAPAVNVVGLTLEIAGVGFHRVTMLFALTFVFWAEV